MAGKRPASTGSRESRLQSIQKDNSFIDILKATTASS